MAHFKHLIKGHSVRHRSDNRHNFASRLAKLAAMVGAFATVAACASSGGGHSASGKRWVAPSYIAGQYKQAQNNKYSTPKVSGSTAQQKIGRPYQIAGRTYVPARQDDYNRTGIASWYGPNFHGKKTANGEIFDMNAMSAAHTTLPIPSLVRVTNLENNRSIIVRLNDRGPFVDNRLIDLSKRAAQELGYVRQGTAKVRVQYIGPAVTGSSRANVRQASTSRSDNAKIWPQPAAVSKSSSAQEWPEQSAKKYAIALSKPRVSASGWFVQLGAFGDRGKAESIAANLKTSGQAKVQTAWINNKYIHRVLVGPYRDSKSANKQRSEVVEAGYPAARVTEQR